MYSLKILNSCEFIITFLYHIFVALRQENFLNVHKIYFFNAQFSKVKKF